MITLFLSMSLLFIAVSSQAVATCLDQSTCITIKIQESSDRLDSDCVDAQGCIDLCLIHNCKRDNTEDDGEISHACPNPKGPVVPEEEVKFTPWHDAFSVPPVPPLDCTPQSHQCDPVTDEDCPGDQTSCMCHFDQPCGAPEADRWVEFAVKDADSCGDQGTSSDITAVMKGRMEADEQSYVTEVNCRVANEDEQNPDVHCEPPQHDECIHKIAYQCDTDTTTPDPTEPGPEGPIPTCSDQIPCLEFDISYPEGGKTVNVEVTYDSEKDGCIKEDGEGVSFVCYNGAPSESSASTESQSSASAGFAGTSQGLSSQSSSAELGGTRRRTQGVPKNSDSADLVDLTFQEEFACDCRDSSDQSIKVVGFKDAGGCGPVTESTVALTGEQIDCAIDDGFCEGGNQDACVYTVHYNCCEPGDTSGTCCDTADIYPPQAAANSQSHMSVFGLQNVSSGQAAGIYSGIVIGGIVLVVVLAGMIWFCAAKAKARSVIKTQMEVVESGTPHHDVAATNETDGENDEDIEIVEDLKNSETGGHDTGDSNEIVEIVEE